MGAPLPEPAPEPEPPPEAAPEPEPEPEPDRTPDPEREPDRDPEPDPVPCGVPDRVFDAPEVVVIDEGAAVPVVALVPRGSESRAGARSVACSGPRAAFGPFATADDRGSVTTAEKAVQTARATTDNVRGYSCSIRTELRSTTESPQFLRSTWSLSAPPPEFLTEISPTDGRESRSAGRPRTGHIPAQAGRSRRKRALGHPTLPPQAVRWRRRSCCRRPRRKERPPRCYLVLVRPRSYGVLESLVVRVDRARHYRAVTPQPGQPPSMVLVTSW